MAKLPILIFYRNESDPVCINELMLLLPHIKNTHANLKIFGDIDVKNYKDNVVPQNTFQASEHSLIDKLLVESMQDVGSINRMANVTTNVFIHILKKHELYSTYDNINTYPDLELVREEQSKSIAEQLIKSYNQSDDLMLVVLNLNLAKFMKPLLSEIKTLTFFLYSLEESHPALSQYDDELSIRQLYAGIPSDRKNLEHFHHLFDPLYAFDHVFHIKNDLKEQHQKILSIISTQIGPFYCTIEGTHIKKRPIPKEGFDYLDISLLHEQTLLSNESLEDKTMASQSPDMPIIIHITPQGILCRVRLAWLEKLYKTDYKDPPRSAIADFCNTTGILLTDILPYLTDFNWLVKHPAPVLVFYRNKYDLSTFFLIGLLLPKLRERYSKLKVLGDVTLEEYPKNCIDTGYPAENAFDLNLIRTNMQHLAFLFSSNSIPYKSIAPSSSSSLQLAQCSEVIYENFQQYRRQHLSELIIVVLDIDLANSMKLKFKNDNAYTFYTYLFTKDTEYELMHKQEAKIQEYYSKERSARNSESPLHLFDDAFQIERSSIIEDSQTIFNSIMQTINSADS